MVYSDILSLAYFRLIVIVELCERFSFYGCKGPWGNYIKNRVDDPGTPGMLGMGPQAQLILTRFFSFWAYSISQYVGLADL